MTSREQMAFNETEAVKQYGRFVQERTSLKMGYLSYTSLTEREQSVFNIIRAICEANENKNKAEISYGDICEFLNIPASNNKTRVKQWIQNIADEGLINVEKKPNGKGIYSINYNRLTEIQEQVVNNPRKRKLLEKYRIIRAENR